MQVVARVDVRDHFWRDLGQNFGRYFLIEAWSPELALEAFRHDLDVGAILPTTFAMYELGENKTVVVAQPSFSPVATQPDWRRDHGALAKVADREGERAARVLTRLQGSSS
jgi:uncharacterized protein (DUF302 family)